MQKEEKHFFLLHFYFILLKIWQSKNCGFV